MEILSLGEKIKRKRKELGMTLKDLAEDRITPGQISLIESGKSNPSMDLLEYLAKKLNVSVEYIMETEQTQAEKICLYYENIAESYIISKDLISAEQNIEKCLYYAEKYNLEERKAKILYLKGCIHFLKGEENIAQQYFLSSNVIFIKNNSYEDVIKTFIQLGKITLNLKAYHSAYNYFQQGEKVYVSCKIENEILIGEIYYYIAITFLKLKDIEKAIDYTYLAKKKFSHINNKYQYAESLLLLSKEYSSKGEIEYAIKYSKKALLIYREINNLSYVAQIENDLGKLFFKFENLEESFLHLNKSKEIREYSNDGKLIETLINICENYIMSKQIAKAEEMLNNIYEQLQNDAGGEYSNNDYILSYYLLKYKINIIKGDLKEAENTLIIALNNVENFGDKKKIAEISIYLGKFYIEHNKENEASKYLSKGVELFKKLGIIKDL